MDWSLIGLTILIPITALFIALALRDGHRRKQEPETLVAYRDELGRRNLPPNVPHFTIGSLQAQINEIKIILEEHLREYVKHLQLHESWEETDRELAMFSTQELAELQQRLIQRWEDAKHDADQSNN